MAIKSSGTAVGSGTVSSSISTGKLYIKANTGTAVVTIDGHDIKISDSTSYQCFVGGNRSFVVKSGSIDYFTEG
jgi:hypothetical protein